MKTNIIYNEKCETGLLRLPAKSVQCCVTSPPYFGLRDYKHKDQIGMEKTPELFIQKLVEVFRQVHRVLKDDGVLWVNIGDSYWGGKGSNGQSVSRNTANKRGAIQSPGTPIETMRAVDGKHESIKPKDLIGIPWMLAFALRADGWYLRQDIIWNKPNPMPESVTDRCTKAHEYLFLLSKRPNYYFDNEAIKEPCVWDTGGLTELRSERAEEGHKSSPTAIKNGIRPKRKGPQTFGGSKAIKNEIEEGDPRYRNGSEQWGRVWDNEGATRNKRSVWNVATKPFKDAHFAVFPPELIIPCIKAGSKPGDVVLDPFFGSGTTGEVALRLEREYIGFEISPEFIAIADRRLSTHKHNLFSQ